MISEINKWLCELCNNCFSTDSLYWLFSTIAQALTAFIALIFTGYVLFYTILNNKEQQDDTLVEIHEKLKQNYFNKLIKLFVFSLIAIILSLILTLFMDCLGSFKCSSTYITLILTLISFILGFLFIIDTLNPKKYSKIAKTMLNDLKKDKPDSEKTEKEDKSNFIELFIDIEKNLNDIFIKYDNHIKIREYDSRKYLSFRKMIDALLYNELISYEEHKLMLELSKVRNLVFHGKLESVDSRFLDEGKQVEKIIDSLKDRLEDRINNTTQQ